MATRDELTNIYYEILKYICEDRKIEFEKIKAKLMKEGYSERYIYKCYSTVCKNPLIMTEDIHSLAKKMSRRSVLSKISLYFSLSSVGLSIFSNIFCYITGRIEMTKEMTKGYPPGPTPTMSIILYCLTLISYLIVALILASLITGIIELLRFKSNLRSRPFAIAGVVISLVFIVFTIFLILNIVPLPVSVF